MKTIEVHAYICQLEGEVGKWHHYYKIFADGVKTLLEAL